jgi:AAA+ ATPase superfamily predicted ATPase
VAIIGRTAELAELSAAWARAVAGDPELAVVWGRRRVGKTYLLTHFAQGKRAVYFTATRQDADDRQLRRFAEALREQLGDEVADLAPATFPTWEAALRFVAGLARTEPLLVVLDEAPRLTGGHADFADTVSAVWENHIRSQQLMLVLTGSAVAVMEQMLGPQGGLHRRAGVERRMDPFPLIDARAFQPDLSPTDFIQAYAACGGYPLHLSRWSAQRSIEENLEELAFTPGGLLLRDAPDILSEDLDWRGGYERVLTAMAAGARRRSKIAGRAQQRIDYTLDRLRRAGYVRLVRVLGSGGSTDPLYEIADDYLAYWFGVLRDDADLIEGGQGSAVARCQATQLSVVGGRTRLWRSTCLDSPAISRSSSVNAAGRPNHSRSATSATCSDGPPTYPHRVGSGSSSHSGRAVVLLRLWLAIPKFVRSHLRTS